MSGCYFCGFYVQVLSRAHVLSYIIGGTCVYFDELIKSAWLIKIFTFRSHEIIIDHFIKINLSKNFRPSIKTLTVF